MQNKENLDGKSKRLKGTLWLLSGSNRMKYIVSWSLTHSRRSLSVPAAMLLLHCLALDNLRSLKQSPLSSWVGQECYEFAEYFKITSTNRTACPPASLSWRLIYCVFFICITRTQ